MLEECSRDAFGEGQWLCTDARGFDSVARELCNRARLVEGETLLLGARVREISTRRGGPAGAEHREHPPREAPPDVPPDVPPTASPDQMVGCAVELTCDGGAAYRARTCILTASLGVLQSGAIRFEPALPAECLADLRSFRMGRYVKVFAEWARCPVAEWEGGAAAPRHTLLVREAGEGGGGWPLLSVVPPPRAGVAEAEAEAGFVLCATACGEEASRVEALTDDEITAELVATLAAAFPAASVPAPAALAVRRWGNEPLYMGAYSFLPAGALPAGWERLHRPLCGGRVFLGGEAMQPDYSGYLQGALLSGREAAGRAAAALA